MKIAYVCNEYPPRPHVGGIGTFTHIIAHGMLAEGHDVCVVGYGPEPGEWNDKGVRVVILPECTTRRVAWFVNRYRLRNWLMSEVRSGRVDIIETPESHGLLPFAMRGCQVVVRLHLNTTLMARNAGRKPRWLLRYLENRTLSCHRHWLAVSKYILEETLAEYGKTPNRSMVIYNPVCESPKTASPPSSVPTEFVLYAGTVSDRKGAFVLAEAARSILAEHLDLHLVYVGGLTVENGRRAEETIRNILGEELAARVHFTGPVDHDTALACMKKAKVFAFPSKLESFGLVPVEAMSCGTPVVYTTAGPGPEIIDDGVTGLLADPYSPNDVAEKVLRILNDPPFAAQLAQNGKKAVKERFSLQQCVDDTLAFYEKCLADGECNT